MDDAEEITARAQQFAKDNRKEITRQEIAVILAAPVSSFPPKADVTNKWSGAGIQLKYASGIAGHDRGEAALFLSLH